MSAALQQQLAAALCTCAVRAEALQRPGLALFGLNTSWLQGYKGAAVLDYMTEAIL